MEAKAPSRRAAAAKSFPRIKRVSARRAVNHSLGGNIATLAVLLLLGIFTLLPLVYIVSNAFKPMDELFVYPPHFFVRNPTLDNFRDMFTLMNQSWVPFTRYLFNTLFVTGAGTLGHLFFASMCAYVLAKHVFPGRDLMFKLVVTSLMFSTAVTSIPTYIIISKLNLLDNYLAIILPAFQSTLGLYLMKQFMETLPDSVLESARIDGAGEVCVFWRIAMPMVKPAWITLIILMVQSLWNIVSPYTYSEPMKTMPQAMSQILAGGIARTGASSAVALVMMVVPLSLFIFSQSRVIETMSTSGMKE